ncbi:hypothetical protein [Burkholderia cenocepacia]|uniref:hypothetical protein n=1 Tax=Burkholderia cenocepacia TaxID=95486 RepID=UPI001B952457|nr:hypothetical protein [Burkholderia cenocepacia]ELW9530782.1 hypothetical protein [Burkholderia cenocepacia]MBR8269339.1 hypothetical protein [Burkholderia cenocepacia]MDI9676509.1 hypothetical protein [Burkholderia cenocepacia]
MWCNLHHAAKLRPYWLSAIRSRRSSFLRSGATASAGIRQLPASTAAVTKDKHRAIADDWLRHAITGIRVMHLDDDERRRVAKQLF